MTNHNPFMPPVQENIIILGTVGSAKSSFTRKVCVIRPVLLNKHRVVVFDKRDQDGAGEYTGVVERMVGTHLRFTADGEGARLNLLDPQIIRGTRLIGRLAGRTDKEALS